MKKENPLVMYGLSVAYKDKGISVAWLVTYPGDEPKYHRVFESWTEAKAEESEFEGAVMQAVCVWKKGTREEVLKAAGLGREEA